jgi:hypothetical protein
MKTLVVSAIAFLASAVAAAAQTAPDLKGTWSGPWKTVIYGSNMHHPGRETLARPPRVREISFTMEIEGQDGRLIWGKSWSNPSRKEPFAAYIAPDGKTIVGSDTDGSWSMSLGSADRIDGCYTHTALGRSRSIVASCGTMQRSR